jgi:hypothetical protein
MGIKKCITLSKDKELRIKDKKYLKWVASNPCIICQQYGCNAHHITYAMERGIGQKVGDQFTIPLCVKHHHQLHNCMMSERQFWEKIDIDPIPICAEFYSHFKNMWGGAFFYDDSMLWIKVYNKLVPKIKKHIDFLLQPK